MEQAYLDAPENRRERTKIEKAVHCLLRVASLFIVLEPIWMLLPFAGFLYGSVMHIHLLGGNPSTAWLVHFVFPVHTLFPIGLVLMVAGFSVFLVGAIQIYSAKLSRKGLVTNGIYKTFRHPQYVSLALFGLGVVLTWGRFITYTAYFIMMWLYYYLSKREERQCLATYGKQYEAYRRRTCFLFPGEELLLSFFRKAPAFGIPAWGKAVVSLVLVLVLAAGSGYLAQAVKRQVRTHLPLIEGSMELPGDRASKLDLVMVKGPALQAAPVKSRHRQYWDNVFEMLTSSEKIRRVVHRVGLSERHTLLAFLTPGSNWRSSDHHDDRHGSINAYMVVAEAAPDVVQDDIIQSRGDLKFVKLIKAQALSYERFKDGKDPAAGDIVISGPPIGMEDAAFHKRIQNRINFFISGF